MDKQSYVMHISVTLLDASLGSSDIVKWVFRISKSYKRKCNRGGKKKKELFFPLSLGGHGSHPPVFKGDIALLNLNEFWAPAEQNVMSSE